MPARAKFASLRADLIVVEKPARPIWHEGRQTGTEPAKMHEFSNHQCTVENQGSIDFMRDRAKAIDGPTIWELEGSDVPTVEALLAELATAEVPRIRQILKAEQDGPSRPVVMQTAEAVLDKVGTTARPPGSQPAGKARHELISG